MKKLLPPLLAALCLMTMLAIHFLSAAPAAVGSPKLMLTLGLLIAGAGLALAVMAKAQFRRLGTNVDTFDKPNILVTSGCFRWGRNPMYLGMLVLLIGAAVCLNSLLVFIGPLVFFLAATLWYIPFEEQAARAEFGEAYVTYCSDVRRWL